MKEKASIDKVYARPKTATMPTLLKFQNGRLAAISKENTQFCRMLHKQNGNDICSAAVVAKDQVYHGAVDASETSALTDSYICVRNKITNKVRIIPIEQATLNNQLYSALQQNRLTDLTEESSHMLLLKQFGGRKASRYATNQENMKVNVDVLKDDLDTTVNETPFNEDAVGQVELEKNYESLRPKFNKDAKKLHEIYDIHDVVPADLLERLDEEAKVMYSTTLDKLPITSEYLRSCIQRVQSGAPSAEAFLQLKLIIYMDCLINLMKTRTRALKDVELSGITEKAENDVRVRFAAPNVKNLTRTNYSTEKALCYFLVLALLNSENYQVDMNVLAQELCISKKKILKFAHIINARVASNSDLLVLRLPSTMTPLPSRFGRRGKK